MQYLTLMIVFSILLLPGIVFTIIPILPGVAYMFIVSLIFGFIDHFNHLTVKELVILGTIALVAMLVDYFSGIIGAKYSGATKKGLLFGAIGSILGLIIFPPFGSIIGTFIGVLIAEFSQHKNLNRAQKAATGTLAGTIIGIVINFILALASLVLFIIFSTH